MKIVSTHSIRMNTRSVATIIQKSLSSVI